MSMQILVKVISVIFDYDPQKTVSSMTFTLAYEGKNANNNHQNKVYYLPLRSKNNTGTCGSIPIEKKRKHFYRMMNRFI